MQITSVHGEFVDPHGRTVEDSEPFQILAGTAEDRIDLRVAADGAGHLRLYRHDPVLAVARGNAEDDHHVLWEAYDLTDARLLMPYGPLLEVTAYIEGGGPLMSDGVAVDGTHRFDPFALMGQPFRRVILRCK